MDPQSHVLKIVDFGLAKFIQRKTATQIAEGADPAATAAVVAAAGDSTVSLDQQQRSMLHAAASSQEKGLTKPIFFDMVGL